MQAQTPLIVGRQRREVVHTCSIILIRPPAVVIPLLLSVCCLGEVINPVGTEGKRKEREQESTGVVAACRGRCHRSHCRYSYSGLSRVQRCLVANSTKKSRTDTYVPVLLLMLILPFISLRRPVLLFSRHLF